MPLRVAFDLDGVLADMDGAFAREATALFGTAPDADSPSAAAGDPDAARPPVRLRLSPGQVNRLWRRVEQIDGFWATLDEIESGTIARLAALAASRRWEVIFLTSRPPTTGATTQIQTQRWLQTKGFELPSVYVIRGSRGRIAAALDLDVVVDDRPENCLDVVVDSEARAILLWRDPEAELPAAVRRLGIGVVHSASECLDILAAADMPPQDRPTLMRRLKRLVGLDPSPMG